MPACTPLETRDGVITLTDTALTVIYLLADENTSLWSLTPGQVWIGRALGMIA